MKNLTGVIDNKDIATKEYVDIADATKQAVLVSGTNIKTINGTSLLGSGNIGLVATGDSFGLVTLSIQ